MVNEWADLTRPGFSRIGSERDSVSRSLRSHLWAEAGGGTVESMRVTPGLKKVDAIHDDVVRLTYAGSLSADVGLAYILELGPVFEDLQRPEVFRRLRSSRAANTVTWPNGADIAPESLYKLARQAASVTS